MGAELLIQGPEGPLGQPPLAVEDGLRPKRRVEPLSPQGSWQLRGAIRMGFTQSRSPSCRMPAPRALRQSMVARMSAERPPQRSSVSPSPSAAQIRSRWAWDLEAGMRTRPCRGPG